MRDRSREREREREREGGRETRKQSCREGEDKLSGDRERERGGPGTGRERERGMTAGNGYDCMSMKDDIPMVYPYLYT